MNIKQVKYINYVHTSLASMKFDLFDLQLGEADLHDINKGYVRVCRVDVNGTDLRSRWLLYTSGIDLGLKLTPLFFNSILTTLHPFFKQ